MACSASSTCHPAQGGNLTLLSTWQKQGVVSACWGRPGCHRHMTAEEREGPGHHTQRARLLELPDPSPAPISDYGWSRPYTSRTLHCQQWLCRVRPGPDKWKRLSIQFPHPACSAKASISWHRNPGDSQRGLGQEAWDISSGARAQLTVSTDCILTLLHSLALPSDSPAALLHPCLPWGRC